MGQLKKIVVENFPVDRLPEELRRGLGAGAAVRVTVEGEAGDAAAPDVKPNLMSLWGSGKGAYTEAEAVSFIRKLRDE